MLERMTYLHKMVHSLFEKLSEKKLDDWLSAKEVCEILNISEKKVRNLQQGGRLGYVRYGRKCLYKAGDVADIAQQQV